MATQVEAKPWHYKLPKKWGFWERFLIGVEGDLYLDRLSLVRTPWFSIKLHRIYRPDRQRDLHDHPWNFLSLVLRGSYVEDVPCKNPASPFTDSRRVRWWNWKRAEDRHSIREVSRSPVWTLVFCGPKRREWGFWVENGTRFVKWSDYEKLYGA